MAQHNCGSYNHSYIYPHKIPAIPLTLILEAGSTCLGRSFYHIRALSSSVATALWRLGQVNSPKNVSSACINPCEANSIVS